MNPDQGALHHDEEDLRLRVAVDDELVGLELGELDLVADLLELQLRDLLEVAVPFEGPLDVVLEGDDEQLVAQDLGALLPGLKLAKPMERQMTAETATTLQVRVVS